ncbi:MAG TPA: site-specific integrase, partial [Saprospiraceae bacterium]|nr:site-specific integrase [Saprospiraceae bacterium]
TGLKVAPEYWNEEKQQVRETAKMGVGLARAYNEQLKELARSVERIQVEHLNKGKVLNPDELRAAVDVERGKAKVSPARGMFAYIEQFIAERAASPKYRPESVKVYRALQAKLKDFARLRGKTRLEFKDITPEFWERFRDYLYSLNLAENTVHKQITTLKTVLNAAGEIPELQAAEVYKNTRRLGVSKEAVQKLYLNLSELQNLFELDLSANARLARVRDLFLIGAFTGLRFSDFTQICPEQFRKVDGVEVLQIDTKKTGERVIIPVHPYVRAILARNGGQPPKGITNQKMNEYLKELGTLAGLNEPLIIAKTIGGTKTAKTLRQYELLSTHTARRSFATNAYKEGVPSLAIMKITGHRTEAAFLRYIQISKEENAVLMAKNAFFQISPLRVAK